MKLGDAYPLRLEDDIEAAINTLVQESGLSKADILRLSCREGFKKIDWSMWRRTPMNAHQSLKETPPPYGVNSAPAGGGAGSPGKLAENLGNALLGKEVRPERPTSKPLSYRSKPRPLRKK